MGNNVKGLVVDVKKGTAAVTEFEDSLENLYSIIGCKHIDVTVRRIGGIEYDIVVDDEGLFKEESLPSAFDGDGDPVLVGNLVFLWHDEEGNFVSLDDRRISNLCSHLTKAVTEDGNRLYVMLGVEYA